MAAFNPERFLSTQYTEAGATERPLIPEGDWRGYFRSLSVSPGNTDGTVLVQLDIEFDDADLSNLEEMKGKDKIETKHTFFIETDTDGNIMWSGGRNWQLGQARAAVGQNEPGKPWTLLMLENMGPVIMVVEHREFKKAGPDGKKVGTGDFTHTIRKFLPA